MRKLALIAGMAVVAGLCIASGEAATRTALSAQDMNYLQTSMMGDRFEIIGGHMALSKSTNPAVDALAHRLITDHSKSLAQSISLAKRLGVKVPTSPSPSEVWELNTVRLMGGSQFDLSYSTLEMKDHQQDIEETTFEAVHGSSPQVKAAAKKELPMLKMHLQLSKQAVNGSA